MKHSQSQHSLLFYGYIAAGIILISVAGSWFLVAKGDVVTDSQTIAPLPTGMNPNFMRQVDDCFFPVASLYGYTLRVTADFRSAADQAAMYDQGRSVDGHIVTEALPGHSLHNYGYAVDVVDRFKGYNINWDELIAIGAYCHLESGGTGDLPHFEYRGGLSTDQFADGLRPPPLTLPCSVPMLAESTSTPLTMADLDACGAPDFSTVPNVDVYGASSGSN